MSDGEPILVWGAGAIGATLGAYWARAGVPVLMVDIVREHVDACRTQGVAIEGPVESFVQRVDATTPDALSGRYARVVLAVKAQATESAMAMLAPHVAADGFVLSAQNGLNELTIAEHVGAQRTMGCFVNFAADWLGPGRVLFGNRGAVVVGEIDGTVRDRTRAMHALLQRFEPQAELTADIWGYLWGKLGYGAMLFATALTDDSMADSFGDPRRFPAFRALGREVMAVAAARGVVPRGFNGFEPAAFAATASDDQARACIAALTGFTRRTAKTHSGIHRDLAVRRRRTEVDPQLTIVARLGREAGVPTPALDTLVTLIRDIEDGRRPMSFETFRRLLDAC